MTALARPENVKASPPFGVGAGTPVACAAGSLFTAAGLLKLLTPGLGTFDGWPRALGTLEVLLGCWLMSGVGRRWALPSCVALFAAFAAHHGWKAFEGDATSCGCFGGAAQLSHGFLTLLCAAGSVACLSVMPSLRNPLNRTRLAARLVRGCFLALTGWTLVAAVQAAAAAAPSPRTWAQDALDRLPGEYRRAVASGSWRVLFVDPGCDKCQHLLAETEAAYLAGLASEKVLLVLTGSPDPRAQPLLSSVAAEVVSIPDYAPPCVPAVVVTAGGVIEHTTCGGPTRSAPRSSFE